ncbi:MAG: hypothetical protein KKE24_08425 [Candidatus Thermoplasmatota archaeon]|nr:hypothetical protein [Candidatus Thermoplasmatota archaeon]
MDVQGIDEFMRYLKAKYDDSERKDEWRALSGRDHVSSNYDTFILTDQKIFQIKSKEISSKDTVAIAREVGGASPDMVEMIQGGAPVPLNVISRAQNASAVIMFGMQQYSSDITDVFRREYYGSKQDDLKAELDHNVKNLLQRPEYKSVYRSMRRDRDSYFA